MSQGCFKNHFDGGLEELMTSTPKVEETISKGQAGCDSTDATSLPTSPPHLDMVVQGHPVAQGPLDHAPSAHCSSELRVKKGHKSLTS